MTHTHGLTIALITLKFSADFNFEPFVIFNPLSYCWAHWWAKSYWYSWYRSSWCPGLVCWWRYLNVVDVIWRRTYVSDSSVGIGIFSYGSFEGIVWHAFQLRRFIQNIICLFELIYSFKPKNCSYKVGDVQLVFGTSINQPFLRLFNDVRLSLIVVGWLRESFVLIATRLTGTHFAEIRVWVDWIRPPRWCQRIMFSLKFIFTVAV